MAIALRSFAIHTRAGSVSPVLLLAGLAGVAIFTVDTFTMLNTAVAVLYGAVVMVMADHLPRRGILLAGATCIGLALASFVATHSEQYDPQAILRCAVSIAAISVITLLSLRNQASNESLRAKTALLDLTHDAILVRAPDDTILYWNRGAEQLYGFSRREAVGRKTSELLKTIFPGPRDGVETQLLETARWEGDLRHTRRDGSEVVVSSRWSLQTDKRGQPAAVMETNNDITARQRSEDELRTAQAELAHVNRVATLGQLTASIAHEVNQPLAAVVTNGEACLRWLRRAAPDVGEAEESVERMIANGRRAGEVVARLRALSRREAPRHVPTALDEALTDALALMEWELAQRAVQLDLSLEAGLPEVAGDRVQLQQVVINLVMNAAQAMEEVPAPRRLAIAARRVRLEDGAPGVAVSVRDHGVGTDPAEIARLFEPFHSSKPGGMGLGLSICRSIVEAHGGRIDAAANAGGGETSAGMTFRFVLPVSKEAPP